MMAFLIAAGLILFWLTLSVAYRDGFRSGMEVGEIVARTKFERRFETHRLRREHATKGYGVGSLAEYEDDV
ncbi:MAG: hypothetical protein O3C40_31760 [Planctomycetota bacterium]|nr:hypothetical protein [Planctomycetota bacterium]